MRVGTPERAPPTSYNMHQDHCTSPLPSQNTWHSHDSLTSTTSVGTTCTTPVMSIQAELESPLETTVPHHASCTKAKYKMGLTTKSPTRGFRKMFRLTQVQVGLRPIEELVDLSSAHNTSLDHTYSPTHQQSLNDYSRSLTLQSTTFLTSPCSTSSVLNQELQPPPLPTSNDAPPPSNSLKRKVMEKNLEFFAKWLRIVARGLEPVYFDPETIALIPQSSLEYFILKKK